MLRRSPRLLKALRVSVSLGALALIVRSIASGGDGAAVLAKLSALKLPWLALALALHLVSVGLGVGRWALLLRAEGHRFRPGWLLRTYFVGRFIGVSTPSTVGLDFYRAMSVGNVIGDRVRPALLVGVEKVVGFLGLSLVALAVVPFGAAAFGVSSMLATAAWVLVVAVVLLALYRRVAALCTAARFLPAPVARRLADFTGAVEASRLGVRAFAASGALSAAGHAAMALVFVAATRALGLPVSSLDAFVVGIAIVFGTLLPISVGGIGVREGIAVVLLGRLGVLEGDAALVGTLGFLAGQVPALAGGLLSLLRAPEPRRATVIAPWPGVDRRAAARLAA